MATTGQQLADLLRVEGSGQRRRGAVPEDWGVHGIPNGGVVAALAASAVLDVSGQPDLLTMTSHFLRRSVPGPVDLAVHRLGGSRRFTSWSVSATQGDGEPFLTAVASVGDRGTITGPSWTDRPAWVVDEDRLLPPAGDPAAEERFPSPWIAQRVGQRIDARTAGFVAGHVGDEARVRMLAAFDEPDQLAAIIACDASPPAVWNAIGREGWVPTLELTVHLRARPAGGPLRVEATTHHVTDGLLEEDATVHDASGTLVAQSRQLALVTSS